MQNYSKFFRTALVLAFTWLVFLPCSPAEGTDDFMTVVATGVGKDSDAALKNAFRAAVEQAVGVLVNVHTLVEEGDVLSDKILSHSRGFISQYKPIGEPKINEDGSVEVRIKAEVKQSDLTNRLKSTGAIVEAISGESLYAQALTKIETMKSEKEMWHILPAFFKESKIPESLYGAKLTREPYYDVEKRKTFIEFEVFVNQDQYNAFVDALREVLKTLRAPMKEQTIRYRNAKDKNGVIELAKEYGNENRLDVIPVGKSGIALSANRTTPLTNFTWQGFVTDDDSVNGLQSLALKEWNVRIECQNATGNTLYRQDRVVPNIMTTLTGAKDRPSIFFIYPVFLGRLSDYYGPKTVPVALYEWFVNHHSALKLFGDGRSVKMFIELDWTPEQLRDLSKVQFSFHAK